MISAGHWTEKSETCGALIIIFSIFIQQATNPRLAHFIHCCYFNTSLTLTDPQLTQDSGIHLPHNRQVHRVLSKMIMVLIVQYLYILHYMYTFIALGYFMQIGEIVDEVRKF